MMDGKRMEKGLKIVICVLAFLLIGSLMILAGTVLSGKQVTVEEVSAVASANVITSEKKSTMAAADDVVSLSLYKRKASDNTRFQMENMFPGDSQTQYFCVQVSYKNSITVRYHAAVRNGYEKMAEVLKTRIILQNTGEVLYDGLMGEMPESLDYTLAASGETTEELYYEITVYLDSSVGNAYQNQELIADFEWWTTEKGNLASNPKTGDASKILMWSVAMAVSMFIIFLLLAARKKEGCDEHLE